MSKPYTELDESEQLECAAITRKVVIEVHAERHRQDVKWGVVRDFPNMLKINGTALAHDMANLARAELRNGRVDWSIILEEEFWEALAECNDDIDLRKELIQVAAVCVAWIEAIDRRKQ